MQGATSRSERQELRARRVQARMQLKAILFITLVPFSQGMEGQAPGENAFLQQMPQQQQMLANTAERAIGLLSQSSTAGSSTIPQGEDGLQAASRIL